jgi:hypothetical protein
MYGCSGKSLGIAARRAAARLSTEDGVRGSDGWGVAAQRGQGVHHARPTTTSLRSSSPMRCGCAPRPICAGSTSAKPAFWNDAHRWDARSDGCQHEHRHDHSGLGVHRRGEELREWPHRGAGTVGCVAQCPARRNRGDHGLERLRQEHAWSTPTTPSSQRQASTTCHRSWPQSTGCSTLWTRSRIGSRRSAPGVVARSALSPLRPNEVLVPAVGGPEFHGQE